MLLSKSARGHRRRSTAAEFEARVTSPPLPVGHNGDRRLSHGSDSTNRRKLIDTNRVTWTLERKPNHGVQSFVVFALFDGGRPLRGPRRHLSDVRRRLRLPARDGEKLWTQSPMDQGHE